MLVSEMGVLFSGIGPCAVSCTGPVLITLTQPGPINLGSVIRLESCVLVKCVSQIPQPRASAVPHVFPQGRRDMPLLRLSNAITLQAGKPLIMLFLQLVITQNFSLMSNLAFNDVLSTTWFSVSALVS